MLTKEYNIFMAIGEALQSYYIGCDFFDDAIQEENEKKKMDKAFLCADYLQNSMVLVQGGDAEVVAMAEGKIGLLYYRIMKDKIRARAYFKDAMNLALLLPEHGKLYQSPWYVEITKALKEIQDKAKAEDDARWENRRKPVYDKGLFINYVDKSEQIFHLKST